MHGVARRDLCVSVGQFFCAIHHFAGYRKNFGKQTARQRVDSLAISPTAQSAIPVEDLLQDLGVDCGSDLTVRCALQKTNGQCLVGMFGTGCIHRNVRVDKDHGNGSTVSTDSRSICSGDPTGKLNAANCCTAAMRSCGVPIPYCARHALRTSSPTLVDRWRAIWASCSNRSGGNRIVVFLISSICGS